MENPFLAQWYYHLPNFILAALGYTLLARLVLGLVIGDDSPNFIQRFFVRITRPAVAATALVTPRLADGAVLVILAFVWTLILRIGLLMVFAAAGIAPSIGGANP